jgi:DNA-binding response OmpR family regulator
LAQFRMLSIDDSKVVHGYLETCFPKYIFDLMHITNAEERLGLLNKDTRLYSLLLLEWEMPGINGLEAVKNIRALSLVLPEIMVTSKNDSNENILFASGYQ